MKTGEKELKVLWEPTERQARFLSCGADEIGYGGAAGGGKSDALIMACIGDPEQNVFNNSRWKALILRRNFPELERTLIDKSKGLFSGMMKWDGVKHRWSASGGGIIQFGHMKTEMSKYDYKSSEYNVIAFDEATEFLESMYLYMFSRNRSTDSALHPRIFAATNPGGVGHGWFKRRFIEDSSGRKIKSDYIHKYDIELPDGRVMTKTRCFIPAKLVDNPHLNLNNPGYVGNLMVLPDVERRALMDGDWNIYSGQFFTEFSDHHICKPFDFPLGWPVWISMDWGYATWCAVGFYTQDPESEQTIMFDEIFCTRQTPEVVARAIKDKLGKRFIDLRGQFSDRRIQIQDEDLGISTRSKFNMQGIYFSIADDDHRNGWHRARELFMRDKEGRCNFQVFSSCSNFIEKIPNCIHDMNKPEDMDRRGDGVHMADQFRYFAIMRKISIKEESTSQEFMKVSPRTGYVGMISDSREGSLKNRIKRLPELHGDPRLYFAYRRGEEEGV